MKVAIIGAGNVGKALTSSFTRAGHDVTIAAAHPDHARDGRRPRSAPRAAGPATQAVADADLVVLAVPATALDVDRLGDRRRPRRQDRRRRRNRPTPDPGGPRHVDRRGAPGAAAEEPRRQGVQHAVRVAPGRPGRRRASPSMASWPATTSRPRATVLDALERLGFRPVDAGPLAAARTLEGMAWLNISRNMAGGTWQDAFVIVGPDTDTPRPTDQHDGEANHHGHSRRTTQPRRPVRSRRDARRRVLRPRLRLRGRRQRVRRPGRLHAQPDRRQPPRPGAVLGRARRAAAAARIGRPVPPRLGGPDDRGPRRRRARR